MKKDRITPDTLVIVESPSKAKTIHKYLGDKYVILSSVGHIIDLPKSRLAIDIDNSFRPEYITIRGKAKVLSELKKQASSVKMVLLATDPDREGEAISWHLANALSSKNDNIKRIEFNEITEAAIKEAVMHPRDINMNLVNAQQARRVLDRIVGYYISPILWKKVKKGLSAGRVQSVALRVICEREKEVDLFIPKEYWSLDVEAVHGTKSFKASLVEIRGVKADLREKKETETIAAQLEGKTLVVSDVKKQSRKRKPPAPFITSKLQQDAANRLGYTSQKTMMIAQQLYEGVEITGEGPVGLITYMRTDSTRVSNASLESVREYIASHFSTEYLPESPNVFQNKKGAQDAHEAIRPTDVRRSPDVLKGDLTRDQYRLYDLIWRRFIASQMTPEVSELTSVMLIQGDYLFRAGGSTVISAGFTAVEKENKTEKNILPEMAIGDSARITGILPEQHFTSPPPRFTDASLVKFLEESAIGRPSTYAPTIGTLIKRYYVTRSGKQLVPTVLGKLVNDIMTRHFESLVSVDFTANMEGQLDLIEDEKSDYLKMLSDFYAPFKSTVDEAEVNISEMKNILDEETDEVCEKCGRKMVKKLGKYGFFVACTGFPECRNSKAITLGQCPKCGNGSIIKRSSKKGRGSFYACTTYPQCDFLTRDEPTDKICPQCSRLLFRKRIKNIGERLICINEDCGYHVDLLDKADEENGQQ